MYIVVVRFFHRDVDSLESLQFYLSFDFAYMRFVGWGLFHVVPLPLINRRVVHQRIDSSAAVVKPLGRALSTTLVIKLN